MGPTEEKEEVDAGAGDQGEEGEKVKPHWDWKLGQKPRLLRRWKPELNRIVLFVFTHSGEVILSYFFNVVTITY